MIKFLDETKQPKTSELGGKGYSLAVLINNSFNVPKGFVITSEAFFKSLKDDILMEKMKMLTSEITENNFQEKSREIKNLILNGKMSKEIASEIKENLNKLNVQHVSIRSSAVSEDSLKASFAGLHDTYINVNVVLDLVLEKIRRCWASLFNERALMYRMKKKIQHLEGMAVVIQEMISSEVSGITFTVHPNNEKTMLIELASGMGEAIVGGELTPRSIVLNRKTITIEEKKKNEEKILISDDRIIDIASICLEVEKLFNCPQDIEWCTDKGILWILQSRAITTNRNVRHVKLKMKEQHIVDNARNWDSRDKKIYNTASLVFGEFT
jgi:pyruvate,water dikinase